MDVPQIKEIRKFIRNDIPKLIDKGIQNAVERYKNELIDYQVNRQWFDEGEMADGTKIKPLNKPYKVYSQFTVKKKRSKGQPTDRVTWKDTGRFHASVRILVLEDRFIIEVDPSAYRKLVAQYGEGGIGIQDIYLREFANKRIMPEIKALM